MNRESAAPLAPAMERMAHKCLLLATVAAALLIIGWFINPDQFFQSYLLAFLFVLGLGLGSLAIHMLHNLTGGAWGFSVKRPLEAGASTIPWLALLFVPVLFGLQSLYEWSHEEVVASDPILQHKAPYLNIPFFITRAAIYFGIWYLLERLVRRMWRRTETDFDPRSGHRLRVVSAPGLAVYCLTATFASVDWMMSLEPHWFSTMYGVHFFVSQALGALCLAVLTTSVLSRHPPFDKQLGKSNFHDLGNLMFAFVMLWAYISFSQFLIIWSGNLPEETPWYLHRTGHGWQILALVLILFHFAVPFFLLLSRRNKRHAAFLTKIAAALLVLRVFDLAWQIVPAFHHDGLHISWMDPVAVLALSGFWFSRFFHLLKERHDLRVRGDAVRARFDEEGATA